jgi:hypothetical protein
VPEGIYQAGVYSPSGDGRDIAIVKSCEADGILFAASWDLLAACQYVSDCTGTALTSEQANTLRKRVQAAIADALGSGV